MRKRRKTEEGMTIVEVLVGITVFLLILGAGMGSLYFTLRAQREILARQAAVSEINYSIGFMSRALRMAKKDYSGSCIPQGENYEVTGSSITFINSLQENDCQTFTLDTGTLEYTFGGSTYPLSSPNLEIEDIVFNIQSGANEQPRVTLLIKFSPVYSTKSFRIQTSISQRNLDVSG